MMTRPATMARLVQIAPKAFLRASAIALLYGALATALSALLAESLESQLSARGLESANDLDLIELYFFEGLLNPVTETALYSFIALFLIAPLADISILLALQRREGSFKDALLHAPHFYPGALLRAFFPAGALLTLALGLGIFPYLAYVFTETWTDELKRLLFIALAGVPAFIILSLYPAAVDRTRIDLIASPKRAGRANLRLPLREIALFTPIQLIAIALRLALIEDAPAGILGLSLFAALAALVRVLTLALHHAFALRERG